ncbi:MAG: alpha/beta fold hydrolase [Nitrospinae bacterium]|nr:alpha/beta fold hydrolase [Nitrospinota bacterium]
MGDTVQRSRARIRGFDDPELDFQLMRSLAAAEAGGGCFGEIMAARTAIGDGGPAAWTREFDVMAQRVLRFADERLAAGRGISAREAYLRAAEYFRSAEYFEDPRTERQRSLGLAARDAFMAYARLLSRPPTPLAIPFEGMEIGGYFFSAGEGPRPTLMALSGFDGTSEEIYLGLGKGALDRGYNLLVFDGPGQMGARRRFPEVHFRPDYETPISAVIDYALSRPDVDPDRLILMGISFGGYFATRAAAHDRRIKGLIANSPIVDLRAYMVGFIGGEQALQGVVSEGDFGIDDLANIPDEYFPPAQKANTIALLVRFGQPTFLSVYNHLREYIVGDALSNIACPCLAMAGEGEGGETLRQFEAFASGVSGPVEKRLFTVEEGADAHCQANNPALSRAVVFDWLEGQFGQ